jgi:hypothetical protein
LAQSTTLQTLLTVLPHRCLRCEVFRSLNRIVWISWITSRRMRHRRLRGCGRKITETSRSIRARTISGPLSSDEKLTRWKSGE